MFHSNFIPYTDQPDTGAYWRSSYEVEDLKSDVQKLYDELKPFYQQLHAYVRRKLFNVYGSKYVNLEGPIPAHILGKFSLDHNRTNTVLDRAPSATFGCNEGCREHVRKT